MFGNMIGLSEFWGGGFGQEDLTLTLLSPNVK